MKKLVSTTKTVVEKFTLPAVPAHVVNANNQRVRLSTISEQQINEIAEHWRKALIEKRSEQIKSEIRNVNNLNKSLCK